MEEFRTRIGKVKPKGNLALLHSPDGPSSPKVRDALVELLGLVRTGSEGGEGYIGVAAVTWTESGYSTSVVHSEGGVVRALIPHFIDQIVREHLTRR